GEPLVDRTDRHRERRSDLALGLAVEVQSQDRADLTRASERDAHARIDPVRFEVGDAVEDPSAELRELDHLDEVGVVGERDRFAVEPGALAARAELVESIEEDPAHALAELALLGRELLQAIPLTAADPARDQRAEDVASAERATVVHRLLDPPDDPLEVARE